MPSRGTWKHCGRNNGLISYVVIDYSSEMYPFGVGVSILEPGFFKTNLLNTEKADADTMRLWAGVDPETRDEYGEEYVTESRPITG